MKTWFRVLRTSDWAEGSPSNRTMHTAKTTQAWLRDSSVNVLEWPSQSSDLNPIKHLWRDLEMAVHWRSLSNLTELERICRQEWQEIPKSKCAELVVLYLWRLEAVITARGASTKYWVKGLNTYVNVIFQFFLFNKFAKISKIPHLSLWGIECRLMRGRKKTISMILA